MSADYAYLDSSAFVKTVNAEAESAALERFLAGWPQQASSTLLRVEAVRALRRVSPELPALARARMRPLLLLEIDAVIQQVAASLDPPALRSLDAIHVATALSMGSDLGVVITYDERMAAAARAAGLRVASPA